VWPLAGRFQHSLIACRGLLAIRRQCLARHLLHSLHVEGALCRCRRLQRKELASARRMRPRSLQKAVALLIGPAAPPAAWRSRLARTRMTGAFTTCLASLIALQTAGGMARSQQRKDVRLFLLRWRSLQSPQASPQALLQGACALADVGSPHSLL